MEIVGADADFATLAAREWLELQPSLGGADVRRLSSDGKAERREQDTVRASSRRFLQGDGRRFDELSVSVQRRCLYLQLLRHGIAPNFDLVEDLRLKTGKPVSIGNLPADFGYHHPNRMAREEDRPGGRRRGREGQFASRDSNGLVYLHREEPGQFEEGSLPVDLKGRGGRIVFGGVQMFWHVRPGKFLGRPKLQAGTEVFDAEAVGPRILLRHWQPGDRFQPIGMESAVKLQDLFTNAKIPQSRRKELILALTAAGDVFWVEGLRISERYKLSKRTIRRLHWRWQRR
jgi:tRNA(Ile)-lysidine synthetase-like protein